LFNIAAAEETTRERPDLIVAGQRTKETNTPCSSSYIHRRLSCVEF